MQEANNKQARNKINEFCNKRLENYAGIIEDHMTIPI